MGGIVLLLLLVKGFLSRAAGKSKIEGMKAAEIRQKYLDFFAKLGHKIIPPAPLVPENDPSTLFTSSGMQPLVPYLKGEAHPMGQRLVDSQPSIRLQDIEEVGDTCHTTFFEMLGNWSLGDYFKKEQLDWFLEFLTSADYLKLPKEKLYVSVFEGTKEVPRDSESFEIWKSLGIIEDYIFFYGSEKNWWSRSGTPEQMPVGEIGGPDSEVFFDFGQELDLHEKFCKTCSCEAKCHPNCQCGRFLEIGNSVFMQYEKKADGKLWELPKKNVDFGGGLERLCAATNGDPDIFKIDLFAPLIHIVEAESHKNYNDYKQSFSLSNDYKKSMRIIADHLRAAVFLISQGVEPSNTQQGYVLRRLIRRAVRHGRLLGADSGQARMTEKIVETVIESYDDFYPELTKNQEKISQTLLTEEEKFGKTLSQGLKEFEKILSQNSDELTLPSLFKRGSLAEKKISGKKAFYLYESFGFPVELTMELASEKGYSVDLEGFKKAMEKHQELSRTASAGMFKGGLANHSEEVTKLHTATHLLHASLRKILGVHVQQKGSNITAERLRFDFSHPQKMTDEEIEGVEGLVNEKIKENLPVTMEIMDLKKAQESGALGFFKEKYSEKVKVYKMGEFSMEICGGPHVDFTGSLKRFKIIKEEAAGLGVRRIYGVLNP